MRSNPAYVTPGELRKREEQGRVSFDGRNETNMDVTPKERGNERAWKDHFRPVEKTPGTFSALYEKLTSEDIRKS